MRDPHRRRKPVAPLSRTELECPTRFAADGLETVSTGLGAGNSPTDSTGVIMTDKMKNGRKFIVLLLLTLLFLLPSCRQGKWQAEGKFVFFDDGSSDVMFYVYPIDKDARDNIKEAKEMLTKEYRDAKVVLVQKKKEKYLIVHKKLSPKKNFYLKKIDGKWQFKYLNQFYDNVEIRKMEVIMPGWITKTNSTGHVGNYAYWNNLHVGTEYSATSTGLPFIYILGLIIMGIVMAIGGGALIFIYRRDKEDKTDEDDGSAGLIIGARKSGTSGKEEDDGVFKY